MTTLTDIGAFQEAQAGLVSANISRLGGAGNTKAIYWDVMMGTRILPSPPSRLTPLGRFFADLAAYVPTFYAPLTNTLVPTIGTGSPTFTRATTKTGQKYDSSGLLDFTALSGEAVFTGARRVQNLLSTTTEDFSNGAWVKGSGGTGTVPVLTSGQTDPDGGTSAWRLQMDAGDGAAPNYSLLRNNPNATGSLVPSIYAKSNTGSSQSLRLRNPGAGGPGANVTVTTAWTRLSVAVGTYNTGAAFDILLGAALGTSNALDILIWHPSLNSITGETDQTTLREYVSVGVLSAPFHGSGVDGVKAFPTDLAGSPIPAATLAGYKPEAAATNLQIQSNALTTSWTDLGTPASAQNAVGPNGQANYAWTLTDNSAVVAEGIKGTVFTPTAASWVTQCKVAKTVGATSFPVLFNYLNAGTTSMAACTIDTNNGIATPWTAYTGFTGVSAVARCRSYNALFWLVELVFTGTAVAWKTEFYPAGTTNATQSTGALDVAAQGSAVVCDFQTELGASATSYQPTTTIAVARNADIDSMPTSGNITAAAGSISLTHTPTHTPSGTVFLWGTYVDASNYTAILHDATNLIFRKRIAGANTDATIANAFTAGKTYKMCATWGAAGQTIALNGVMGTPHANTTAAQIAATMQVGADGNSLQQPGMNLKDYRDWTRQVSDSEAKAITV